MPRHAAPWLAAGVLGLTGFASLMHEIVWTRILALVLGPTIYAFAATVAVVIGGVALGSALGAWLLGRVRRPELWLGGVARRCRAGDHDCVVAGRQRDSAAWSPSNGPTRQPPSRSNSSTA